VLRCNHVRLGELKYEAIRTPFEQPLLRAREIFQSFRGRRHPELRELFLEERRIQDVLKQVITRRSNCVDIGCHFGSMLSVICRLAPEGHHVAFEAIPDKVRFLRRKFPDVDLMETALSDEAKTVTFYINRLASGFSGLARHGKGDFEEIRVPTARLDDVLPRDRRFDFVKIDVEGAELLVLRGAAAVLSRDQPVILFECGPSGPVAFGYSVGEVHDFLTGTCGYSVFLLKDFLSGKRPIDRAGFEAALVYPFQAFNWIALPGSKTQAGS
jgi:FkbM family methyltransferase